VNLGMRGQLYATPNVLLAAAAHAHRSVQV